MWNREITENAFSSPHPVTKGCWTNWAFTEVWVSDGGWASVCTRVCVCAREPSAFGCLLPVIMTWGDSSNQSCLIIYCNRCLARIKGVSRFLFRPSKETCYYSIVSGISGNPGKCPDKFSLKIKLSSFLTVKTLLTVGFRLSGCNILRFQLWKGVCNRECLHLFYQMNFFFSS